MKTTNAEKSITSKTLRLSDRLVMGAGICIFLLAVYLPFITGLVQPDQATSKVENRALAQLPKNPSSFSDLKAYPKKFNDYYADQFGFRESLNFRHTNLEKSWFKQSSSIPVTQGKDGWLFLGTPSLNRSDYHNPFSDIQKVDVYSSKELQQAVSSLVAVNQYLKQQGIHYTFVIAPNKHTIYSDRLPDGVAIKEGPSATDQLVDALRKTDVHVVDLRPALLSAKQWALVYYRYDSHWNAMGANIAQHTIMSDINKHLDSAPTPKLLTPWDFAYYNEANFGDLLKIQPIPGAISYVPKPVFKGVCVPERIQFEPANKHTNQRSVTTCSTGSLKALIFRDSFYGMLAPYLLRQFAQTTAIFGDLSKSKLDYEIGLSKPDIVIEQLVERKLPYIPNFN
jgi:hypothetical protein